MKVLLIENEQDTINAINGYFIAMADVTLVTSADIVNGVNKIKNQEFDLIIVNQELFKKESLIDFSEVYKKSLNQKLNNTILLSKSNDVKEIETLIKKGFRSFITTPFSSNSLHEKISKIIKFDV